MQWNAIQSWVKYHPSFESIGLLVHKKWKIDIQDGGHIGFPIRTILAFFIYKSPQCFLSSFQPIGLLVQDKKLKIDIQDGGHGGNLGFPIRTILAIFDLQVNPCFLPSFESTGLSVQEKKPKIDFQDGHHGSHHGFLIKTILTIFYLQFTPILATKFRVIWPFGSGEEAKNRFSRRPPWRPSWIFDRDNFT